MFKRKKKKTGCETQTYSCFSIAPEPTRSSEPNPNYVPPPSVRPSGTVIQCLVKRGTTEDYKEYNPTLQLNELAVEYNDNKIVGYKLGDDITKWSELEYVTNLTDVKEFWLYCGDINNRYVVAKIVLNPFSINNSLGGIKVCSEQ